MLGWGCLPGLWQTQVCLVMLGWGCLPGLWQGAGVAWSCREVAVPVTAVSMMWHVQHCTLKKIHSDPCQRDVARAAVHTAEGTEHDDPGVPGHAGGLL